MEKNIYKMTHNLNRCTLCLSKDRQLIPVIQIMNYLKDVNFLKIKHYTSGICWECRAVIMKYHRLSIKAMQAQILLSQNKPLTTMPMSTLKTVLNKKIDYEYKHRDDPLNSYDRELNTEEHIKAEYLEDNFSDGEDLTMDDSIEIKEDSSETQEDDPEVKEEQEKQLKQLKEEFKKVPQAFIRLTKRYVPLGQPKKKRTKEEEEDFDEKIEKVKITEKEMLKNREDKRQHFNFKKLPFKCDSCVLGFTKREKYELHMKLKHKKKAPFYCEICCRSFPSEWMLNQHRERHYTCYRCRLCRYETTELWSAIKHCTGKHKTDSIDEIHCTQCDDVFKNQDELKQHNLIKHKLCCAECNIYFKARSTLSRHNARIHSLKLSKRPFACELCGRTFNAKSRMESHMVTHNPAIAKKLAYCNVCKVQYKNLSVYRSHLKTSANHSERRYPCPECDSKFASKSYLSAHFNFYHLRKSRYYCETCDKLFISDWLLKRHKQTRHGFDRQREHSCNTCGKQFFTLKCLQNHELTHSDERTFMCEDCGDTFKQRPSLYTHSRLVHGHVRGRKK